MKLDLADAGIRSLLDAPSPATLTLCREDGEAITSPVWFRVHDDGFEVVVAATDRKLEHLRREPLDVCGVAVRARPTPVRPDSGRPPSM